MWGFLCCLFFLFLFFFSSSFTLVYRLGQAFIPELCQDKSGSMPFFPITWNQFYVGLIHISFTLCTYLQHFILCLFTAI